MSEKLNILTLNFKINTILLIKFVNNSPSSKLVYIQFNNHVGY